MNDVFCDYVNGMCICVLGWFGVNCMESCFIGYYGM